MDPGLFGKIVADIKSEVQIVKLLGQQDGLRLVGKGGMILKTCCKQWKCWR